MFGEDTLVWRSFLYERCSASLFLRIPLSPTGDIPLINGDKRLSLNHLTPLIRGSPALSAGGSRTPDQPI